MDWLWEACVYGHMCRFARMGFLDTEIKRELCYVDRWSRLILETGRWKARVITGWHMHIHSHTYCMYTYPRTAWWIFLSKAKWEWGWEWFANEKQLSVGHPTNLHDTVSDTALPFEIPGGCYSLILEPCFRLPASNDWVLIQQCYLSYLAPHASPDLFINCPLWRTVN